MISKNIKAAPAHMELPPAKLRWRCELSRIPFETTAQAELREGFSVQEVLFEDGRVVGVRGHEKNGPMVTERARITVNECDRVRRRIQS